jgi:MoxR-like ATPase
MSSPLEPAAGLAGSTVKSASVADNDAQSEAPPWSAGSAGPATAGAGTPPAPSSAAPSKRQVLDASAASDIFERIVDNVALVVQGKLDAIRMSVVCLIAEGHLLIEDVPGVGKTSLGKALAASVDCSHRRIQFTSDLLPSDVTGTSIFNRTSAEFEFRKGPIFANLVLGDEINRTPPKTQSALLEAMEERQVTVDATTYPLPAPFMVVATQNPIEHEGTYPLPISELDRFLMRIELGYPARTAEIEMLDTHGTTEPLDALRSVASPADVVNLIERARSVYCSPLLQGYIVDLASATRAHPAVALGMSPRAGLALQRAARAWAAVNGRDFVVPDDLKALARPVLVHRVELNRGSRSSAHNFSEVLDDILARLPVPTGARAHS